MELIVVGVVHLPVELEAAVEGHLLSLVHTVVLVTWGPERSQSVRCGHCERTFLYLLKTISIKFVLHLQIVVSWYGLCVVWSLVSWHTDHDTILSFNSNRKLRIKYRSNDTVQSVSITILTPSWNSLKTLQSLNPHSCPQRVHSLQCYCDHWERGCMMDKAENQIWRPLIQIWQPLIQIWRPLIQIWRPLIQIWRPLI